MHRYYTEELHSMEERIDAAIQGVQEPGSELSRMRAKYAGLPGLAGAACRAVPAL